MAGTLKHTMVVRNPDTLVATALVEGSELPDWATDLVHPDNLEGSSKKSAKSSGDGDNGGDPYKGLDVEALSQLVDERNASREDDALIVVTGTGKDGNVLKKDLLAALEADDKSAGADS